LQLLDKKIKTIDKINQIITKNPETFDTELTKIVPKFL